jgi:RND family efflux transporter MFP subunit
MAASNPPEYPSSSSPEPLTVDASGSAIPPRRTAFSPKRWSAILGILLLMLGLGFGWRWWQTTRNSAAPIAQPRRFPVKLASTQVATIRDFSEFVGSLESQRSVVIRPEITGRVSEIRVKAGDRVEAGTPLVQLQPDKRQAEFASVLATVNSARASRATAQSELQALLAERASEAAEVELQKEEFQRISTLVREGALPQQQLDQVRRDQRRAIAALNASDQRIQAARSSITEAEAGLQQAQANANLASEELQDALVTAPFAGTVGDIPVRLGQLVSNNDTLTSVTQNQVLDLRLSIPINRASVLRQGQRVELTDGGGKILSTGRISFISPRAQSRAQSILAKATFDNSQGRLRDGQSVRARVIWQERPGILIPTAAISRLGGETFVFVAQPAEGQPATGEAPPLVARQKPVKLGSLQGNQYQVIEGLQPGEQLIVSGVLNLADGVPIAPQTQSSAAPTP